MRGRKPIPSYLKVLRGNPGQRQITDEPQPALPAEPPEPPDHLTDYGREEWRRIIREAYALRLCTPLDVHPLGAYCAAYSRWRTAEETISIMAERDPVMRGLIVKTQSGGAAPNPLVIISQNAARDMVRFASEFGLTPVARSRIKAIDAIGDGRFSGLLGPD
jgi:P27 family predicted phage terminase small subunit